MLNLLAALLEQKLLDYVRNVILKVFNQIQSHPLIKSLKCWALLLVFHIHECDYQFLPIKGML